MPPFLARLTSSEAQRVIWNPFDHLEIKFDHFSLWRERDLLQKWFAISPPSDFQAGPMTFATALDFVDRTSVSRQWNTQVEEIGEFERLKDELRLRLLQESTLANLRLDEKSGDDGFGNGIVQGITLSPGNYCSGGCAYCYAKPRFTKALSAQTSDAVLRGSFELIRNSPIIRRGCGITIGGGGDPVENVAFYLRAIALSKSYRREHGITIPVYIATVEPSFLTEELIGIITENQDWITLSADGDPALIYHRPRTDFSRFPRTFNSRCHWAASAVFTAKTVHNIAHNYEFLLEAGFEAIQMRPARLPLRHPLSLKPGDYEIAISQYSELLHGIGRHDRMPTFLARLSSADALGHVFLRFLTEIAVDYRCASAGAGRAGTIFVDPSGVIFPCPSTAFESVRLGDIWSESVSLGTISALHDKHQECGECTIFPVCAGPCLYESILTSGHPEGLDLSVCRFQKNLSGLVIEMIRELYNTRPAILGALMISFAFRAFGLTDRTHACSE